MSEKVQLKHLLLDVNFKDKPKIIELEELFTPLARLLYIDILASMSTATNGRLPRITVNSLARRIGFKETSKLIDWCLEHKMLDLDGDCLTNSRVLKDQESLATKREQSKTRMQQMRNKSVTLIQHERNPVTDTVTDTVIIKDLDLVIKEACSLGIIKNYPEADQEVLKKAIPKLIEKLELSLNSLGCLESSKPSLAYIRLYPKGLCRLIIDFKAKGLSADDLLEGCVILNDYIANNKRGQKYKDHAAAISNWVIDKILDRRKKETDLVRSENYLASSITGVRK